MRPLSILLLTDDRPGHYHLAEGVIAAIERRRPVAVTRVRIKRRRWAPGRVLAALTSGRASQAVLRYGYGISPTKLPRAALVVSAGGDTLYANVAAARVLGARNIFCGTLRRLPPQALSLVVSSYARHASLPHHLVSLKPNGIDPDKLGDRAPWDAADGPPKLAGLLIGGDSGFFHYTPEEWERLVAFLTASHRALGVRWIVSTSRRSPDGVADAVARLAAMPDGPIAEFIDFRTAGPGTLPRVFGPSQVILCTEDSSSMISEAVCARLPVVGVAPADHGFKDDEREYRAFMQAQGWCRFLALAELSPQAFTAELERIVPLTAHHLDTLAGNLAERLPELFQEPTAAAQP